jgi:aspartate/methionine/tyrosine aminotransferase
MNALRRKGKEKEMKFADRMSDMELSGIRRILDLAEKMKDPINFSIGRPDFDVPQPLKDDAKHWIQEGYNKYTVSRGDPMLIEKLHDYLKKKKMIFEDVIATVGVAGGLTLVFTALVNPGDEVLFPDPYFLNYYYITKLMGGVPKFIDTYPDFRLRAEEIEKKITKKTKFIIINSPNNPTGQVYTREELEMVIQIARKHNLFIVSDDVYERFIYDEPVPPFIGQMYEKTIILNGFSKSWAMTGWRLGYVAGPKEFIAKIIPIQQYFYSCPPSFAQRVGVKALDYDVSNHVADYRRKRDLIYNGLKDKYNVVKPRGAFYIFPEAPGKDGEKFVEKALQNSVFMIPGKVFSQRSSHFRISFAVPDETILKGVEILNKLA